MPNNAHGLALPTTAQTRELLGRTLGADADAAWGKACAAAGSNPLARELSPQELLAVAKQLVALGGRGVDHRKLHLGSVDVLRRRGGRLMTTKHEPTAPTKVDDLDRLQEIVDLDLLSRERDPVLDAITAEAAQHFGLPISCVSIVMSEAQYFAASTGLGGWIEAARGTPGEWAFCRNAVDAEDDFEVTDAESDPFVADNPLVTQDGIRCYLGAPLRTSKGHVVGTLCVIGTEAREFDEAERKVLRALADRVVAHVETKAGR